jgi:hypothetical protein
MGLKIRGSYDTEIYITEDGYVAIKQVEPLGAEDTVLLLAPEQLSAVGNELLRLDSTKHEWYVEPERKG